MKAYFFAIAVSALAASAFAVENEWQNLNRVSPGQKIEVVQTNMVKHTGKFVAFTDEGIALRVGGTERTIVDGRGSRFPNVHSSGKGAQKGRRRLGPTIPIIPSRTRRT